MSVLLLISLLIRFGSSIEVRIGNDPPYTTISLSKASQIVEYVRSKSGNGQDATVIIDGGNHEPMTLTSKHSNTKFISTSNSTVINGGYRIISPWNKQNGTNNIWTTSIKLPWNYSKPNNTLQFPKQFWMNDKRKTRIQTDMLFWESILNPTDKTAEINKYGLVYKKGDIKSDWNLFAPGVIIYVFHQWTVSLHQVKYHNFDNQTIIFQQPSAMVLGQYLKASKKRWYIEGIPEMTLSPNSGQWKAIYDNMDKPSEIIINYAPFQNETFPPNDNDEIYIEHPWLYQPLINLAGNVNKRVVNVSFDGFQLKYSPFLCPTIPEPCDGDIAAFLAKTQIPAAIFMRWTKDITIKNSVITHVGSYGIYAEEALNTNILVNNITYVGAGGVYITSQSNNSLISDNRVINGGFIFREGLGIGGGNVPNLTIQHNEITRMIGLGIGFSGANDASPYFVATKNHIHHNGRSDNYGISDFGAIHVGFINCTCLECRAQITNNKFHDIISVVFGGNGIYLDNGSDDVLVYGNLVYNIGGYGLIWNYNAMGRGHKLPVTPVVIQNNIFIVSGAGMSTCPDSFVMPQTTFDRGMLWNTVPPYFGNGSFINNIQYVIKPNGSYVFSGRSNDTWFAQSIFDYNVYYAEDENDHNAYFPGAIKGDENMITLAKWQANMKEDIHSKIEDPMFVNSKQCNFDLETDSPVFKDINFRPLNISDAGPRALYAA